MAVWTGTDDDIRKYAELVGGDPLKIYEQAKLVGVSDEDLERALNMPSGGVASWKQSVQNTFSTTPVAPTTSAVITEPSTQMPYQQGSTQDFGSDVQQVISGGTPAATQTSQNVTLPNGTVLSRDEYNSVVQNIYNTTASNPSMRQSMLNSYGVGSDMMSQLEANWTSSTSNPLNFTNGNSWEQNASKWGNNNPVAMYQDPTTGAGLVALQGSNGRLMGIGAVNKNGIPLRSAAFNAQNVYELANEYGINLSGIGQLGQQLDAKGIAYKPYELYAGTGSDHGIDFNDIAAKGMGSAYDWTKDVNAGLKDSFLKGTAVEGQASNYIAQNQQLANNLGLVKNQQVTTDLGFDDPRANFTSLVDGSGSLATNMVRNGNTVSWYADPTRAQNFASQTGNNVIDMSGQAPYAGSFNNLANRGIDTSGITTQPFVSGQGSNPFLNNSTSTGSGGTPTSITGGTGNATNTNWSNSTTSATSATTPSMDNAATMKAAQASLANIGSANLASAGNLDNAATYEAATADVDGSQLVQNQLSNILASDSPYIQRAQALSNQASNRRGLINSSMAVQAGTTAAIDAAMPIAQADAQTQTQQRLANLGYRNSALQFNAAANNQNNLTRYQTEADINARNAAAQNQYGLAEFDAANKVNLANADAQTQASQVNAGIISQQMLANKEIASRENLARYAAEMDAYQKELQRKNDLLINNMGITAQSADRAYTSMMDTIAKIQSSAMAAEPKQQAVNDALAWYEYQVQMANAISSGSFTSFIRDSSIVA